MILQYFVKENVDKSNKYISYLPCYVNLYRGVLENGKYEYGKEEKEKYPVYDSWYDLEHHLENGRDIYFCGYTKSSKISRIERNERNERNERKYEIFFNLEEAEYYLQELARNIYSEEGCENVELLYGIGKRNIFRFLSEFPMNKYTAFKTEQNKYEILLTNLKQITF